jgi:hypothetical protein
MKVGVPMFQTRTVRVSLPAERNLVGTRLRPTARRGTHAKVKANANAKAETKGAQPPLAIRVRVASLLAGTLPAVVVLLLLRMMMMITTLIVGQ